MRYDSNKHLVIETASGKDGSHCIPYAWHPGTVACVCVDRASRILLIQQWRPPLSRELIELPGGVLEEGETPEQAAHREILEETGIELCDLKRLGSYYTSVGLTNEVMHLFCATVAPFGGERPTGANVMWVEPDRVKDLVAGSFLDMKTALAISLYTRDL